MDEPRKDVARAAASQGRRGGRRSGGRGGRGGSAAAEPAGGGTVQPKPSLYWAISMWLSLQSMTYLFTLNHTTLFMFGLAADPPSEWQLKVVRAHSSGLVAAGIVAYALENLHSKHKQHTFAADMLRLVLLLYAASVVIYLMVVPYKLDPWAVLYVNAMHQFVFAVPYIDLFGSWEDCARTWRHMRRLVAMIVSLVWPLSLPAALYLLLAIAFAATGFFCEAAHEAMMLHVFCNVYGVSRTMAMENIIRTLFSFLATVSWQLKGQAQKNHLGHPLPRIVNRALMAASVGHLLALAPPLMQRKGGWMLASFAANWGLALLACAVGLAAPAAAAPAAAAPAAAAPAAAAPAVAAPAAAAPAEQMD